MEAETGGRKLVGDDGGWEVIGIDGPEIGNIGGCELWLLWPRFQHRQLLAKIGQT
jgi:hypothetical protein